MLAAAMGFYRPPHRLTGLDQVHLTLLFIGDTSPKEIRGVSESVERSAAGIPPFSLTPTRLVTYPTKKQGGPVRLLAVETDTPPGLLELQRRLAQRLSRASGRKDRFAPHLTVVRFQGGQAESDVDVSVSIEPFHVDCVRLMQSNMTRHGAEHVEVSEVRLVVR